MKERPPPPRLEHPWKWGPRPRRSGKKTPNGIEEEEEQEENAKQHQGEHDAHERSIQASRERRAEVRGIYGVTRRTGPSRAEHEGEATTPNIATSGEMRPKERDEWQKDTERQQGEGGAGSRCTWTRSSREWRPRLDQSGRSTKGWPPPPGLEHAGKWGLRQRRSGKKTPSANKEKEEP